jgi:Tol biopolymer transport system component
MLGWFVRWGIFLSLITVLLAWLPRLLGANPRLGNGTGVLAYGSGRPNHSQIYLHDIANDTITQLTTESAGYYGIDWSPDGTFLAYSRTETSEHGVYIQEVSTGIAQRLNRDRYPNLISWSRDGCCLAYVIPIANDISRTTSIAVIDLQTNEVTSLGKDRAPRFHPIWSPDGRYVLYSHFTDSSLNSYISALELATGNVIPMMGISEGQGEALAWSPDGTQILLNARYSDGRMSLLLYALPQESLTSLFHDDNWYVAADWSPDGRYIALSNSGDNPNLAGQIELFDLDHRLKVFLAEGFTPAWQPAPP